MLRRAAFACHISGNGKGRLPELRFNTKAGPQPVLLARPGRKIKAAKTDHLAGHGTAIILQPVHRFNSAGQTDRFGNCNLGVYSGAQFVGSLAVPVEPCGYPSRHADAWENSA